MKQTFYSIVRDLSHKGLGVIDHPDGRSFFVRGTWPGDEGEFAIDDRAEKYSEAILVKLLKLSAERIEVACPHRGTEAGKCGGCPWMMADYSSQLKYKKKRLQHVLEKRKVVLPFSLKDPVASPSIYSYRNRVQLKTDGKYIGYVSEGTSVLAPINECLIMNEPLKQLFQQIKNKLPNEEWKPTGAHHWSYLDLDDEMEKANLVLNKRRPFKQGNSEQNEYMKKWIEEKFSPLPRHWPVIDLFCGSGNFTEVLSQMGFSNILAVEVQGLALEQLKSKNLRGVRILGLDMNMKGSWAQIARYQPHAKALLLDPPREGIDKRRGLFKYLDNLEYVFYISCEIDTYSRDVSDFVGQGWQITELTPVDLFPHTPHLEILSSFKVRN